VYVGWAGYTVARSWAESVQFALEERHAGRGRGA